jgi:hypothetical protein
MTENPKPVPPWRIDLQGSDADLKDLASCLLNGRTRISQQDGVYFLESEVLDQIQEPTAVPGKAHALLRVISSVARVRRSMAKPIGFAALQWKDSNGNWYRMLTVSATINTYSNITRLTKSGIFERCVELALKSDLVGGNLNDFHGEWDFPRLRRVSETILLDLGQGDTLKGVQEVVDRGWTSRAECERFWDTVNHGDTRSLGAHSELRRAPGKNPMNVIQAGEFLSDVIAKWLESKM